MMHHLLDMVGDESFCKNIFVKDAWGDNAIQAAVLRKKLKMVKCIVDVKSIKEKLLTDDHELGVVLNKLNEHFDQHVAKYLLNQLELTETKLSELQGMYALNVEQILSVNV